MICLSWNCRGMVNPCAIRSLLDLIRDYRPDFIFLSETIFDTEQMLAIKNTIGYDGSCIVGRSGHSGG